MKFAQLHYFLSQNVGGDKRYYVPPFPKVVGDIELHLNIVYLQIFILLSVNIIIKSHYMLIVKYIYE